jgi:hypothetical protein
MGASCRAGTGLPRSGPLGAVVVFLALTCLSSAQPLLPAPEPALLMPLAPLPPPSLLSPRAVAPPPRSVSIPAPVPPLAPPLASPSGDACRGSDAGSTTPDLPFDCPTGCGGPGQRSWLPGRFFDRTDRGPRLWGSAESLVWRVKGYNVPPLVTTGPAQFPIGFLGNPGTQTLFGGSSLGSKTFPGGRFTAGVWLDPCLRLGLEADYFFLGEQSTSTAFNSGSTPVLARPFTNASTGLPFSEFAAFPGIAEGGITIDTSTQLWGAGLRLRRPLWSIGCGGVDLLGGFEYLNLRDTLTITETPTFLPGGPFPELAGRSFVAVDRFATRNQFYGGQLGINARLRRDHWLVDLRALVGIGTTHQEIDIQGSQRVTDPVGGAALFQGGLLALAGANIGHATRDSFTVVPQVMLNLGYRITERITVFAGYTFLYWSSVVRPGDQIDPVLDVTRIPNFITNATPLAAPHPVDPFQRTDFWAHGVNFGVGLNW